MRMATSCAGAFRSTGPPNVLPFPLSLPPIRPSILPSSTGPPNFLSWEMGGPIASSVWVSSLPYDDFVDKEPSWIAGGWMPAGQPADGFRSKLHVAGTDVFRFQDQRFDR